MIDFDGQSRRKGLNALLGNKGGAIAIPGICANRLSGRDGEFAASGLAEGEWILEAKGLEFLPVRATLPLTGGATRVRLVLVPQPTAFDPLPIDLLPEEEPIPPPAAPPVEPGR